ncbi:hypothetical protein BOTBODRAFT_39830 [Botryobasidium botryosum FD-172 SS1]|uniref:Uncharacterized protein n=1 Tax=Botryobasidium botryosum (strain FD-172 SS1) TaxID=930990 RepID=A0A067M3C4_BOTB1|nr:hypothetical protein BOTBODRAFT_39830 [Botryobasidium botryosum FD-172 SS1]
MAICFSKSTGVSGCLVDDVDPAEFVCPRCLRKSGLPVPYKLRGAAPVHGGSLPRLVFMCLRLGLEDTEWAGTAMHGLLHETYSQFPTGYARAEIIMSKGQMRQTQINARLRPIAEWVIRQPTPEFDFFALVDSHTDAATGYIAYSRDAKDVFQCVPIGELLAAYINDEWRRLLGRFHGLKGLALLTCGEAWTNDEHFRAIKKCVADRQFDFVVGFTGPVLAHLVVPSLMDFVSVAFLRGGRSRLLAAFFDAFAHKPDPLSYTPAILLYREKDDVVATEVRHSQVAQRVWGIRPPTCPALPCMGHDSDLTPRLSKHDKRHERCFYACQVCKGRSAYIPLPRSLRRVPGYDFSFHHRFGLHDSIRAELQALVAKTWHHPQDTEKDAPTQPGMAQPKLLAPKKRRVNHDVQR